MHKTFSLVLASFCLLATLSACGPYRIRYKNADHVPERTSEVRTHAHGLGLIGGGGYFFFVHQMFPALVDYTGPVKVPSRFAEVSHYHTFGQNAGAAFLSWLVLVNAYHESMVEIR
jgi:hypothetical protein